MTGATPDLPCRELVELVTDYLEDRMAADDRTRFERHLAGCDGCRAYLAQLRQVIAAAGRLAEAALAPKARDELLQAFRGWRSRKPKASPGPPRIRRGPRADRGTRASTTAPRAPGGAHPGFPMKLDPEPSGRKEARKPVWRLATS